MPDDYRPRVPTIPDALTESHHELDGAVRVRERTRADEIQRDAFLQALKDLPHAHRLDGAEARLYDAIEEQVRSNVRVSRLEQHRDQDRQLGEQRDKLAREFNEAVMRRFDAVQKAATRPRRIGLREVLTIVGVIAGAVASIVAATRGTSAPPPDLHIHGGQHQ